MLSPNWDERALPIQMVVIHYTEMKPVETALDRMCDPDAKVSAHYCITEEGEVIRLVPEDKRAWHAGLSSFRGRGRCNDCSVGIELQGCDVPAFTTAQYSRLSSITGQIRQLFPAIGLDRIVGHSDIAPGRKTDPGPLFDWERYRRMIG